MNVFEAVKQSVTTRRAAEHYGILVGRNGMCVCPFHDDKNPSMKVDRRFHCFGCQADGDVIDFVSRLENVSPREAALMLAQDFSIPYEDLVTHTFTITMAVFDMAQHVVSGAAGVIGGNTNIDVDAALSSMQAGLDAIHRICSVSLYGFIVARNAGSVCPQK